MRFELLHEYNGLAPFVWSNVPQMAVVIGKNGVGKSQLLRILAAYFKVRPDEDNGLFSRLQNNAQNLVNLDVEPELASRPKFYSSADWTVDWISGSSLEAVKEAASTIPNFEGDVAEKIARIHRLPIEEVQAANTKRRIELLTPQVLHQAYASRQGSHLRLAFLVMAYQALVEAARHRGVADDEIIRLYGSPPWDQMDRIFEVAGLPYALMPPIPSNPGDLLDRPSYQVKLRRLVDGVIIDPQLLSSGEKVIAGIAGMLYAAQDGRSPGLYFLDEPDAHLHPALAAKFLRVLELVLVREHKSRVILTTHSPTTALLAPMGSLFELVRPTEIRPIETSAAVTILAEGLVVAQEGMAVVLCEGDGRDAEYFRNVWVVLTREHSRDSNSNISSSPPIHFVSRNSKDQVVHCVSAMRDAGLTFIFGIIDSDNGNKETQGVSVLQRHEIENYIYDPLTVYGFLHSLDLAPRSDSEILAAGRFSQLKDLDGGLLQAAVDIIVGRVEEQLTPPATPEEREFEVVRLSNGAEVRYPKWQLYRPKEDLVHAYHNAFQRTRDFKGLVRCTLQIDLVPEEFERIFRAIQSAITGR